MMQEFNFMGLSDLLKRVSHSGYKNVLIHDHMLMNCYNIEEDDDIGMHYVLHVPDTEMYQSPFYNLDIILDTEQIAEATKTVYKEFEAHRKKQKIRPKEAKIIGRYDFYQGYMLLSIEYILKDEVWKTVDIEIPYPVREDNSILSNIISAYNTLLERIDLDYPATVINGLTRDIWTDTMNSIRVFYYPVEIDGKTIRLPFMKSFFRTLRKCEQFDVSVQKTYIPGVYLVVHTIGAKNLTEQFIMYVEDFDK